MPSDGSVLVRDATVGDADGIATLHADSWRLHYRGAFSDAFLDGDVLADRLAVWSARMARPPAGCTVVAVEATTGAIVGFAHAVFDEDPDWGTLVDNLHVGHRAKRRGIGSVLMAETARRVLRHDPAGRLYLWVLEQNVDAQRFYRALGGSIVERRPAVGPGGVPGRLVGTPVALRCAWRDPSRLLWEQKAPGPPPAPPCHEPPGPGPPEPGPPGPGPPGPGPGSGGPGGPWPGPAWSVVPSDRP